MFSNPVCSVRKVEIEAGDGKTQYPKNQQSIYLCFFHIQRANTTQNN